MPREYNDILSTHFRVSYKEGTFCITDTSGNTVVFDPTPYYDVPFGQLISIASETSQFLLYFPSTSSSKSFTVFYIIDTVEILRQFKSHTTDEIRSIVLLDIDKQYVAGTNPSQLMPYLNSIEYKEGIYTLDPSTSLCINTDVKGDFSLVCLISNDFLSRQIRDSFIGSYLALVVVGITGFLLIYLSMKITYTPLHKLTKKIVLSPDSQQEYLHQIELAFLQTDDELKDLEKKLNNYRLSMQKVILGSTITSQYSGKTIIYPNIDTFFETENNKELFIIKIASPAKPFPFHNIQKYFLDILPPNASCIIWETTEDSAIFLINYTGMEHNKSQVLKEILDNLYNEQGYLSAISNSAISPMDIYTLLENTIYASSYWPNIQVVEYSSLPPISSILEYPYNKFALLSMLLKENDFSAARTLIDDLLQIVNLAITDSKIFPDFFVRCILIDILTTIVNELNHSRIKFSSYKELYFETLYFCRSCAYLEKAEEISANIKKLIAYYENAIFDNHINAIQIKTAIESNYSQADFSIATLADTFHVSIAYMSYLVKVELGENFSDYLWKLRLAKAKLLLKNTDKSIDEISIAIGYQNASSFRRKFKQETNLSPSQFRTITDLEENIMQEDMK